MRCVAPTKYLELTSVTAWEGSEDNQPTPERSNAEPMNEGFATGVPGYVPTMKRS